MNRYSEKSRNTPYENYGEYMTYIFDCVNTGIDRYLTDMKTLYATEDGGYKNVLYPDLEVAGDVCKEMLSAFISPGNGSAGDAE